MAIAHPLTRGLRSAGRIVVRHFPLRKRLGAGDVAVVRRKGTANVPAAHERVLQSLGLWHTGSISTGDFRDPTFRGQIAKVPHLVRLIPLSAASAEEIRQAPFARLREFKLRDTPMKKEWYEVPDSPWRGASIKLVDGEYLEGEQGEGVYSLLWSSALPVATVVENVLPVLSQIEGDLQGFVATAEEVHEGKAAYISKIVSTRPRDIRLVTFEGERVTFGWVANRGRLANLQLPLNECSVIVRGLAPETFEGLVKKSATAGLGRQALRLLGQFDELATGGR